MERYRPSGSTWQKRIRDHHQQHREALISAVGLIFLGKEREEFEQGNISL